MSSTPPLSEDIPSLKTQIAGLEAALLTASNKLRDSAEENRVLNESVKSLNKVVEELRTQIHHTPSATPVSSPAPPPVAAASADEGTGVTSEGHSTGPGQTSDPQAEVETLRRKNQELLTELQAQQNLMLERDSAWNVQRQAFQEQLTRLEDQVIFLSERVPPDGSGGATPPPLTATGTEGGSVPRSDQPHHDSNGEEVRRLAEQVDALVKEMQLKQEDFRSEQNRCSETLHDRERSIHQLQEELEGYRNQLEQERENQTELRSTLNDLSSKVAELEATNADDRLRFAEELQKMVILSSVVKEAGGSHPDDKVTLEEVRTVLLTDAEQQLLARDNTTLTEENSALRQMLDGLLKEFEAVTEGTKSLRQQVQVLHQQLKDERQLRDSLVREKSMELESHYAQVLLKKQAELESLGTRLALAEKTIASILPQEQQRNLYGGGTPSYGSVASPLPSRGWDGSSGTPRRAASIATQSASPSLLRSMMADV